METPVQPPARRGRWPRLTIDFSRPAHRRNILILLALLALAGLGAAYGAVAGYEYTESSEFCGGTCHVMAPQYARYENSPHAHVECAQCHIGPGADFFVRSKIDGLRQVYAVLAHSYSRPIKSPVENLRPARETCETCHTPTSYKDNIIKTIVHFDNDQANTRVQSTLILKMGGYQAELGQGIHWHITNPVYYIAADEQRQVMSWVGVTQPDGSLKEYFSRDMLGMDRAAFVADARAKNEVRELDCIDCHNRIAHQVPTPETVVDKAIELGQISAALPFIRAKAVEVLTPAYATEAEGLTAIDGLADYYRLSFPEVADTQGAVLQAALSKLKDIYRDTNYPAMGLNWQTNPNNERHTPFPGCFRCHDDKHVSIDAAGNEQSIISVDCNLCHTVPIVGRGDDLLIEAPVIVGSPPETHASFRWTIEHRVISETDRQDCYQCHGQGFCNNGACHNLSHPPDMLYTHAEEYRLKGDQTCYTCHQDVLCTRCHPGGIVKNP